MCFACVSAVNIELNFGNDANSVRLPVEAAAPTHISLLEPYVYVIPPYVFIFDDFFKSLLVSLSWCLFFRDIS